VVVDDVEDLHVRAVCERPVSDVSLPPFVRLVDLEPDERASRPFLGLGDDKATEGEDPPDRRDRGSHAVVLSEVERDRVGARIQALLGQGLPQLDDLLFELDRGPVGAPSRSPAPRLQPYLPFCLEPPDQFVHPLARDPIVPGHFRLRTVPPP